MFGCLPCIVTVLVTISTAGILTNERACTLLQHIILSTYTTKQEAKELSSCIVENILDLTLIGRFRR